MRACLALRTVRWQILRPARPCKIELLVFVEVGGQREIAARKKIYLARPIGAALSVKPECVLARTGKDHGRRRTHQLIVEIDFDTGRIRLHVNPGTSLPRGPDCFKPAVFESGDNTRIDEPSLLTKSDFAIGGAEQLHKLLPTHAGGQSHFARR